MRCSFLIFVAFSVVIKESVAPPPRRQEEDEKHNKEVEKESTQQDELGLEYERYLKEVIDVLESDHEFKKKLEAADDNDIRSGKIAHELDFVDHSVRSKLDEVKRQELERLRHLAMKEYELSNGIDVDHLKISSPQHVDHDNPHTFEIDDLKKLIAKVTSDLSAADETRHEDFKEYEMKKEFEKQEKLKHLEGDEKVAFEKQIQENETKHKQHDPLHHPGSKQQLEEVWEKQDHMEKQEFNPKVFFALHDLDGNGYWDQNEVKALFLKELDKMYQAGAPEDDMRERAEEMERMREHVFKESDKNRDQLISYEEFLEQTKEPEFNKDPGWETVDQKPAYTDEEYRRYAEIQQMVQQGLIPPEPVYYPVYPNYQHPQYPQGQHPGQFQQQHPGQFQQHPGQFQQPHPGQHPGQFQQPHPGQFQQPHPGQHPGQFLRPPQGQHPAQFQQAHHGQVEQHPAQFQQQQQGQHPAQYQQHPDPSHTAQQNQAQQSVNYQGHPNSPPQGQQVHTGNYQGHPNSPPQGQQAQHPGSYQEHPNSPPQGQQAHPGNYQGHPNSPPQGQQVHTGNYQGHPNSPPQGQPAQHPGDYQGHPNSPPQVQQAHPGNYQEIPNIPSQGQQNPPVNTNSLPQGHNVQDQLAHQAPQANQPLSNDIPHGNAAAQQPHILSNDIPHGNAAAQQPLQNNEVKQNYGGHHSNSIGGSTNEQGKH